MFAEKSRLCGDLSQVTQHSWLLFDGPTFFIFERKKIVIEIGPELATLLKYIAGGAGILIFYWIMNR
jgi:hypothetical protein